MSENKIQPEVTEVDDESMDEVSGGLPNGAATTQNGEGSGYGGIGA